MAQPHSAANPEQVIDTMAWSARSGIHHFLLRKRNSGMRQLPQRNASARQKKGPPDRSRRPDRDRELLVAYRNSGRGCRGGTRQGWWGKKDSNLRSHKTADLQSAPFATRDTPPLNSIKAEPPEWWQLRLWMTLKPVVDGGHPVGRVYGGIAPVKST
jgi:hypothetical protein